MTTLEDVAPRAGAGTIGSKLPDGVPRLQAFYLYMTTGCNLCCRHCWITPTFVNGEPSRGDYIDVELLKSAVAEAKPIGLAFVKLTGGEPMIHPQFREIAAFLTEEKLRIDMETNATRIDAETARFLKTRTGIGFVSVSLDGVDSHTHDAFRGVDGAFNDAVNGIKQLVAVGYCPQIIMSPHRGNIDQVDKMVMLAAELGAGSVKFNPVTYAGRGKEMHKRGEALDYDECLELIRYVNNDLQRRSSLPLFIGAPMALLSVGDLLHDRWRGVCSVRNTMGILGTGHMALCGIGRNVPELCYGHLGRDSIRETWISNPFLRRLRKGLDGPFPGICRDCIHSSRCRTGCLAMNYMQSGELFWPAPLCEDAAKRGAFPPSRLR